MGVVCFGQRKRRAGLRPNGEEDGMFAPVFSSVAFSLFQCIFYQGLCFEFPANTEDQRSSVPAVDGAGS